MNNRIPTRSRRSNQIKVETNKPNIYGHSIKIMIREAAKKLPLYHKEVSFNEPLYGSDDDGNRIPINTLGKWIFGTPGYKGNVLFLGGERNICYWTEKNVPEINELLDQAIQLLESEEK